MQQHCVRHVHHELVPPAVLLSPAVPRVGHGGFHLGDVVDEDAAHAVGAEEQFPLEY